jgi:crotonobetainyl-CoA:carnitine CoA-transferase CaiB-like acyl-CoA transferase
MVISVEDETGNRADVVGNPIKFSGAAEAPATYPPALGADAHSVLGQWLACPAGEIGDLQDKGVLLSRAALTP